MWFKNIQFYKFEDDFKLTSQQLLPRALVRASHTYACILPKQGWLIVNAASAKKSEELIEVSRKTLGTLNVVLPATEESPESAMTRWIMNDAAWPQGFTLAELKTGGQFKIAAQAYLSKSWKTKWLSHVKKMLLAKRGVI